jgi:NAD(P)-dependent dehydrogenase (short-subunit alcohol dehydrogenase family)
MFTEAIIMKKFNRKSTAEMVSEGVDLTGKYALVTGANTGLGMETSRVLALRGASVTMACRDRAKAELSRAKIIGESAGAIRDDQLDILELDLNSLDSIRESAKLFMAFNRPLHLLINNAGIMIPMVRRTDDGFEAHLGINHLGHFLLTNLLLDALVKAKGARVVCVSSGAMGMASLKPGFDDINWQRRKFSGMKSYGDSKLMNCMFARELSKRYQSQGIVANALHPGVIATELARDQSPLFMALGIFALPFMKSVAQGAATSVLLATSPDYADRGGLYLGNCSEWKPSNKLAQDNDACDRLWQISAELTGLSVTPA